MKNKLLGISVLIMCLLCGCSGRNEEAASEATLVMHYSEVVGDITTELTEDEYTQKLELEENAEKPQLEWIAMGLND